MGLWIESHQSLARHPKMRRAARDLGVSRATMIGHLHLLWYWAVDYAPDGVIDPADVAEMVEEADWPGDPDTFIKALVACGRRGPGFLEPISGGYLIHDWHEHGGKAVLSREESRALGLKGAHVKWHVNRAIVDPDCALCAPPDSPPNGDPNSPPNADADGGANGTDRPTGQNKQTDMGAQKRASPRKSPSKPLPPNWSPNDTHRRIAREENVNVNREAIQFRTHAKATDRRQVNWNQAFDNWLRKASDFAARNSNGRGAPPVADRKQAVDIDGNPLPGVYESETW